MNNQQRQLSQEFRETRSRAAELANSIHPDAGPEAIRAAVVERDALAQRLHAIRQQLTAQGYIYDELAEAWHQG